MDGHLVAKLTDFGLSLLQGAGTTTMGSRAGQEGTARFLAPEMLVDENSRGTCASDVYAFACLCLEVFPFLSLLK